MTAPNQDQPKPQDQPAAPAPKLRPRQVVTFRHTDPILGTQYDGAGVVVSVSEDGPVVIRPLASHTVSVEPANVSPATAEDVG